MKKTVTINLAGLVFTINDDAYEKLEKYLKAIEIKFADEAEAKEIMHDIETRIGELFTERTRGVNSAITIEDVEFVINLMGNPEAFSDTEDKENRSTGSKTERKKYRRMYRDVDSRVIGGVCSGLGSYLGIDPIIIRILFLVAFFFFGAGVLVYLVLWLVMPEAITTSQKLEMRGEPVNINSISDFVKNEFNHLKNSMKFGNRKK